LALVAKQVLCQLSYVPQRIGLYQHEYVVAKVEATSTALKSA
jgi:hypothetical protein